MKRSVSRALRAYLRGLELEGADEVRAVLALKVAEKVETAPHYTLPKLAASLSELLGQIEPVRSEQDVRDQVEESLRWRWRDDAA